MRRSTNPRTTSRSPLARLGVAATVAAGIAALAMSGTVGVGAASADTVGQTTFVNDGFTGTTAGSGYVLPTSPSATNTACLTAGTSTAVSADSTVPGCGTGLDASGSGALRLTTNANNQAGGVGAKQSVPITKGIDAVFDSYQYNGSENGYGGTADGIVFYLAATDPYNPTVPSQIGQLGGSLGYSSTKTASGLAHAYLGIGIDRYGNFYTSGFEGNGCSTSTNRVRTPNTVTVRGPGDGTTGYCVVGSTATAGANTNGSLSATGVTNRSQARVPVEIVINPTSTAFAAAQATTVTVQPRTYAVILTPIGGRQEVVTGALPTLATTGNAAAVPSSWIDPTTGYPYKLTYGWVAGTGGANDVHEVNYLEAQTIAGKVPVISATSSDDATVQHGGSGTFTVTPTVTADGGTESEPVRTTTTFPAGVTPTADGAGGDGWTCTISGQTETCEYAISGDSTVAAGTALPAVSMPYTVSGSARTSTISSVVASVDAEAVTVSSGVTVAKQPVAVEGTDVTGEHGSTTTLTATVASTSDSAATAPTGTVTFTDEATGDELCTATVEDGVASCDATVGAVGTHTVLVGYSGDADHEAVTDTDRAELTLTSTKIATGLQLDVGTTDVTYGTPATLSVDGLPSDATGTVEFTDADGSPLCTATLPATSCDTAATLAAGTHEVTASYSGDDSYTKSDSDPATLTVDKASTTIGTDPGTGTGGGTGGGGTGGTDDTVTVTHGTPTDLPPTTGLPTDATGTISYVTDDGTVLCTATLPDTTCAVPDDLAGGDYTVHAHYSGDPNHDPADGTPFRLVVAPQPTTVTATTDAGRSTVGQRVRLAVSGLPSGATGTVTFRDADGTELCTVTLPDTSCETDALPAGSDTVTADYSGDASFAASTTSLLVVVDPAATTPTASSSATPAPTATATTAPAAASRDGALAFTGSSIAATTGIAFGAALVIAGLVLLVARRQRREHQRG